MKKFSFLVFFFTIISIYPQQDSLTIFKSVSNDTTFISDTSLTDSISLVKSSADSLIVLSSKYFSEASFFVHNKDIIFNDYRYAGDFLRTFPITFIRDLGFIGQPSETYLYGLPSSESTYMTNGIYFNNRYALSIDLNHIQTESVDSVEIINLPKGFLFGTRFNPVTINFIEKEIYSKQPFTRIKYYEGPFGEAFVDGKFSINVFKRLNISADVSNKKVDNRYVNSDFSLWRAGVKAKYFLSNSINLIASYYHIKSVLGFNGGVDVDSIASYASDINSVLYDNVLAPVKYPTRFLKATQHHFSLRTLADIFKAGRTDLQLYYKFTLDEDYEPLGSFENKLTNKNKVFGVSVSQSFSQNYWQVIVAGNYEWQYLRDTQIAPPYFSNDTVKANSISTSVIATFYLFDSTVVPSFFSRIISQTSDAEFPFNYNSNLFGYGADVVFKFHNNVKLYGGVSSFDQEFSEWEKMIVSEIGVDARINIFEIGLKYFNLNNRYIQDNYPGIDYFLFGKHNLNGSSLKVSAHISNFSLETLTTIYNVDDLNNNSNDFNLPGLTFRGGVYYSAFGFSSNLYLKAGFNFNYTGKQSITDAQYFKLTVDPSYKVDFTLAGQIQKVATVYFTWENLLDNDYFITPYYPMPNRNIRFGLSWELFN